MSLLSADLLWGGGLLVFVVVLAFMLKNREHVGLLRRPVLVVGSVLSVLLPLGLAAQWAFSLPEEYVRFQRPVLVGPAAACVVFVALRLSGLDGALGRLRRAAIELCLVGASLAAALATAGLEFGVPLDRLAVVVLVDRSRSMELVPQVEERIEAELLRLEAGMAEGDRLATIAFGATASVELPLQTKRAGQALRSSAQVAELPRDGTDIARAIGRGLAELPPNTSARMVLLSDGVSTMGDPVVGATSALAAGVPVDVLALEQARVPSVQVVHLHTPTHARTGEPVDLRVETLSSERTPVELSVFVDGELRGRHTAQIAKGRDLLTLQQVAPAPGFHRYDVQISAPKLDHTHDDNSGTSFLRVAGEPIALILEAEPEQGAALSAALEQAQFQVVTGGSPEMPADVAEFAAYDLVVLSDIRASDLSPQQLEAFASYVRDLGGGALLMGGANSLGPGGYARTPIEAISPVSFDLKQERRRASLAEVIAIDYSGSMGMSTGGTTKLALANEAAVRSLELLGAGDRLGVMHVDTKPTWTVNLGPLDDKQRLGGQLRSVTPGGGGIFIDVALEAGYRALAEETTNLKHLLLFADGNDAEQHERAPLLVQRAQRGGVTTSVVALGRGDDIPLLEQLSRLGGGRFYLIEDANRLPAVFAQETVLATRSALHEERFRARPGAPSPVTRGVSLNEAPALEGYVITLAKARAQVLLRAEHDDPLLAVWPAGLGKCATFTSDLKARWGLSWTRWPGASRLFAQLATHLGRPTDDPSIELRAQIDSGKLVVTAHALDSRGFADSLRKLEAHVAGPLGFRESLTLEPSSAGTFQATLGVDRPGAYVVTAVDQGRGVGVSGAVLSRGLERRPAGTDHRALAQIAALTEGQVRRSLEGVFRERGPRRYAHEPLEAPLLIAALCLLVLGVAARRLVLPNRTPPARQLHQSASGRKCPNQEAMAAGSQAASGTLSKLRRRIGSRVARAPRHASRVAPSSASAPRVDEPTPTPFERDHGDRQRAPSALGAPDAPDTSRRVTARPAPTAAEILLERRKKPKSSR